MGSKPESNENGRMHESHFDISKSSDSPTNVGLDLAYLLRADSSPAPGTWLKQNVLNPALNSGFIEGANAIANLVNSGSQSISGSDVLPKFEHFEVQKTNFLSSEWLAQNVSSGLAMVVPYLLASKAAGFTLRGAGQALGVEGTAAGILQHRATASILGAATFDYLRDTRSNETRTGNAIAGAAAFGVFEAGNALSSGLVKSGNILPLILARAATGALGATTQLTLSRQIATGELPGKEEYLQAGITGGIMNNVLLPMHSKLAELGDQVNLATGRGIALDRFKGQSKFLDEIIAQNPWGRSTKFSATGEQKRAVLNEVFQTEKPSIGLDSMMKTGLIKGLIPELAELNGPRGRQDTKWHPEGNAWRHTLMVVDNLAKQGNGKQFDLMLTGLIHDVGKPATQKIWPDGGISNYNHDAVGAQMSKPIMERLSMSAVEQNAIYDMVLVHMKMHQVKKMPQTPPSEPSELWQILRRPDIHKLIELQQADALGTNFAGRFARDNREFLQSKLAELKSN